MQFAQSQKIEGQSAWVESLDDLQASEAAFRLIQAFEEVETAQTLRELAEEADQDPQWARRKGFNRLFDHPKESLARLAEEMPEVSLKEPDSNSPLKIMEAVVILARPRQNN